MNEETSNEIIIEISDNGKGIENIDIAKEFFTPSFPSSNGNYYVDNVLKTKKAIEALIKIHILPTNVEDEKVFIDVIQSAFTNRIIVNSSQQSDFIKIPSALM